MSTAHEVREPSQDQLHQLRSTVLGYESIPEPFEGIPAGIDLRNFVELTAPPTFDENHALATFLKAPDDRVIWLSVFRNPDTRAIARTAILILDPPVNRDKRQELPDEDYTITESSLGILAIQRANAPQVVAAEVTALQKFIDSAKRVSLFDL